MGVRSWLPTLSAGQHDEGSGEACVMEYVSVLAGERWSDLPPCTMPLLAYTAQRVNDLSTDGERHKMIPYITRLIGTNSPCLSTREYEVLMRQMILSLRPLFRFGWRQEHRLLDECADDVENFCKGREHRLVLDTVSWRLRDASVRNAMDVLIVASAAAPTPSLSTVGQDLVDYAGHGPHRFMVLDRMLDTFDELTGRTAAKPLSTEDLALLREKVCVDANQ